jgi:thymidylate synthase
MRDSQAYRGREYPPVFVGNNFNEVYVEILRKLKTSPHYIVKARGSEMREVLNLTMEITDPRKNTVDIKARKVNKEFQVKFFKWIMAGGTDPSELQSVNKNVAKYTTGHDRVNSFTTAYGPRILAALPRVIEELKRDPGTRRASISMRYVEDYDILGSDSDQEFPCVNTLHFLIRDGRLHLHVSMRSNNMVTTLVYDVYNFTMLQIHVLDELNSIPDLPFDHFGNFPYLRLGTYMHNVASAHYFTSQEALVDNILKEVDGE